MHMQCVTNASVVTLLKGEANWPPGCLLKSCLCALYVACYICCPCACYSLGREAWCIIVLEIEVDLTVCDLWCVILLRWESFLSSALLLIITIVLAEKQTNGVQWQSLIALEQRLLVYVC